MTSERAEAYGRLMRTLRSTDAGELLPRGGAIEEAADALLFCNGDWRRSRPAPAARAPRLRPAGGGLTTVALLGDVMLGRSVAERLSAGVWSEELVALCRGARRGRGQPGVLRLRPRLADHADPGQAVLLPLAAGGRRRALEIGTTVAGLANNHALDFGPDALADTVAHLQGARIEPAGVERRGSW